MLVAKFVRTGVAILGAFLSASAAQAADVYGGGGYGGYKDPPPPAGIPVPLWTGFYAGGNIGADWANIDAANNALILSNGAVQATQQFNTSGIFGGIQLGYNIQPGNFLWGIEADLGGMEVGGHSALAFAGQTITASGSGGWYGDLTGRAGYTYGSALAYVKGGFAVFAGNVNVSDTANYINQNSGTFTGWTIGGGVEYMVNPSWTVKVEYLYFDLGNNNCCFTSSSGSFDNTMTMSTVKVGFNFLLHSQITPLN